MQRIFSPDSKVLQFINKIFFSAWLNILWLICCIPIITAGASTTALFYVSMKLVKGEEGNITSQFFSAFRVNWKKATQVWLILLAVGIFLGTDCYILYHMLYDNIFWTLCFAFLIGALIVYLIVLMYVFPLLARFENTIPAMLKNSLFIGLRYLFCSILMAVVYFAMVYAVINIFTPLIVFGQGLCVLICSWLLTPIMEKLEANVLSAAEVQE